MVKHMTNTMTPMAKSKVTRMREVHLMADGPAMAIKDPSTTLMTLMTFTHWSGIKIPYPAQICAMDEPNMFAATAYQNQFPKITAVANTFTPLSPSTARR